MSIVFVECSNCGNPAQTSSINADGVCPRCATGRVSSPPPAAKPPPNIAASARKSFDTSRLDRQPLASKIPLAAFLEREARRNPVIPPPPAMPREAEALSST